MAGRIRSIKPEILEDERSAGLSSDAWRLWVSMWLLADDHGRLRGAPEWLRAQVFWCSPESIKVADLLDELATSGVIVRYTVSGQRYLEITNWGKHQKVDHPGKPRVPGPAEGGNRDPRETLAKDSETLAPDLRPPTTTTTSDHDRDRDHARASSSQVLDAWSGAGLPGLPGADELGTLGSDLAALKLEPVAACGAFKRLLDGWRKGRGVLVPATPAKMRDHMGFVQQIMRGEIDPEEIGRGPPQAKRGGIQEPRAAVKQTREVKL